VASLKDEDCGLKLYQYLRQKLVPLVQNPPAVPSYGELFLQNGACRQSPQQQRCSSTRRFARKACGFLNFNAHVEQ
jgi:hypothetical protein